MSLSSTPFSYQGYSSDISSSDYYCFDSNETECLEHYENNLEKYKGKFVLFYSIPFYSILFSLKYNLSQFSSLITDI